MLWTIVLTYPFMVGIQLVSARLGRVTRVGLDDDRVGQERRPRAHRRELARELAVAQVERTLADESGRCGVPERRGPAVSQHHLVALGQAEEVL